MSQSVGEAVVEVRGDVTRLKSDISGAGKSAGHGFASGFSSSLKGLAESIGLIYAGEKAVEFLKGSVEAARTANKVAAVTEQRIKTTGGAAHVTAKHVNEMGDALARQTGILPDVITGGDNMLLTFKNIRNEAGKGNDIFDKTSKIMVDLAASMAGGGSGSSGMNPKAAAIQLGKALNDPVKGLTSLARVGVQFDDQQKKQIADMVKHNNLLGAQKIILKELNSEFGGTAKAQANASDKMKIAWQLLQEEVGKLLIPMLDKLERFLTNKGIPVAQRFVHQIESGKGAGGRFADALHSVWDAGQKVFGVIKGVIGQLNSLPSWAKKVLITGAVGGFAAKKLGLTSLLAPAAKGIAGTLASEAKPVPVIIVKDLSGIGGRGGGLGGTVARDGEAAAGGGLLATAGQAGLVLGAAAILGGAITYLIHKALGPTGPDPSHKFSNSGEAILSGGGNSVGAESGSGMGLPGGTNLSDLGHLFGQNGGGLKGFSPFPKGFLTDLTGGVVKFQQMKTILTNLGFPLKEVQSKLAALNKSKAEPKIGADSTPLEGRYRQAKSQLLELGKAHPVSTLDANNKPAQARMGEVFKNLGILDHKHVSSTVDVNASQAVQILARLNTELNSIHDKTFTVTTVRRQGGSQPTAANGVWSSPGGPTLVGERGREIVDLPRGSRVIANPRTETLLAQQRGQLVQHIYLPTGDPEAAAAASAARWVLAGLTS